MPTIRIEGVFHDAEELHDQLRVGLKLPDYYGANLDALWDCLTGYVDLPLIVEWYDYEESRKFLGDAADEIVGLFAEAGREVDGLRLVLK